MFGNLLLWVDNLRRLSHSISAEYILEVELYLTSRSPLPINDYGDTYWPPDSPNQKFPYYVISGDSNIQEVLTTFYRDARNLVGHDADGNHIHCHLTHFDMIDFPCVPKRETKTHSVCRPGGRGNSVSFHRSREHVRSDARNSNPLVRPVLVPPETRWFLQRCCTPLRFS